MFSVIHDTCAGFASLYFLLNKTKNFISTCLLICYFSLWLCTDLWNQGKRAAVAIFVSSHAQKEKESLNFGWLIILRLPLAISETDAICCVCRSHVNNLARFNNVPNISFYIVSKLLNDQKNERRKRNANCATPGSFKVTWHCRN